MPGDSEEMEPWGDLVDGVLGGAASMLSQVAPNAYAPAIVMLVNLLRGQLKELIDPDELVYVSSPYPIAFEDLRAKKEEEEED